jgi:hypothetical protein
MPVSAYASWQEKLSPPEKPIVSHPRGNVRVGVGDHFVVRINLSYGPLPIEMTRDEALALSDAIRQLHNLTSPQRGEE